MSAIQKFLQVNASDEQVISLLERAKNGNIKFASCLCITGSLTARHPDEITFCEQSTEHLEAARALPFALSAENEFDNLGNPQDGSTPWSDELRCEKLLPILEAEITRRSELVNLEASRTATL